ncbi:hypothetical protein DXM27_16210 [Rhizobium rhizogenes]|uniref:Uncharacterized protein n=1 Tax=Rhizobium rhizogenes TaxID=359 RepID=A0AA88JP44_RHIRH|nr:hypothetical protein DXM27_16210 [Rhizobium rhizogenes]
MANLTKHSDVILGFVPTICNGLISLTCLDPWVKPKDDVEMMCNGSVSRTGRKPTVPVQCG